MSLGKKRRMKIKGKKRKNRKKKMKSYHKGMVIRFKAILKMN
jgi:hypothetical protein